MGLSRSRIVLQWCASCAESILPLVQHLTEIYRVPHTQQIYDDEFRVFQHPQPPRNEPHLSALLCLPPFPMLDKTLYTMLTPRAIKKQLYGPVCFHYTCLLPYRWQYRYVTTVLPAFARNVFYGGFCFRLTSHVQYIWTALNPLLVLFLHFRRKTRLIKWASVCVSV